LSAFRPVLRNSKPKVSSALEFRVPETWAESEFATPDPNDFHDTSQLGSKLVELFNILRDDCPNGVRGSMAAVLSFRTGRIAEIAIAFPDNPGHILWHRVKSVLTTTGTNRSFLP